MKKLILFFLACSVLVSCSDSSSKKEESPPLKIPEQEPTQSPPSSSGPSTEVGTNGKPPEPEIPQKDQASEGSLANCVQEICGDRYPIVDRISESAKPGLMIENLASQIRPKTLENLKISMEITVEKRKVVTEFMSKFIKEGTKLDLSEREKVFFNLIKLSNLEMNLVYRAIRPNDFDASLLAQLFPSLSDLEIKAVQKLHMYYLLSLYADGLSVDPRDLWTPELESLNEHISSLASLIQIRRNNIYESFVHDWSFQDSDILERASIGMPLSEAEYHYLGKLLVKSWALENLGLVSDDPIFSEIPVNSFSALTLVTEQLDRQIELQNNENLAPEVIFNGSLGICKASMIGALAKSPSTYEIEYFRSLIEDSRPAFAKVTFEKLKMAYQGPAMISFPRTAEEIQNHWQDSFEISVESKKKVLQRMRNSDLGDSKNQLSMLVASQLEKNGHRFDEQVETCREFYPYSLSDHYKPSRKVISLSWSSVRFHEYGLGILAHEIGHHISNERNNTIETTKSCLDRKGGGPKRSEEDFADVYAAEVVKTYNSMRPEFASKNFGCLLMQPSNKDKAFEYSEDPLPVPFEEDGDEHSPGIFRTLAIQWTQSQLPASCQRRLSELGIQTFNNYCKLE